MKGTVLRSIGSIALAVVAATVVTLMLSAGQASAAPPIVCVRNLSGSPVEVVAGVQKTTDKSGVYLGEAAARGGACRYADIDGDMNVSFRRGVSADLEQYSFIPTAGGRWKSCPVQGSETGWYYYTVRRGLFGLTCKAGGNADGLEGPGDYE